MNPNCVTSSKQFYTSNNGPKKTFHQFLLQVMQQLTTPPLQEIWRQCSKDGNKPQVKYNVTLSEIGTCSFDCCGFKCVTQQ
jgi:hypothetical protein